MGTWSHTVGRPTTHADDPVSLGLRYERFPLGIVVLMQLRVALDSS
jgi:hypothetical protein